MTKRYAAIVLLFVVSTSAVVACGSRPAWGADWRKLYTSEGVTVLAKDRANSGLPLLRGVGVLPTNLYLLLAIIDDVPRHPEWVAHLRTSRMLWRPDAWHARVYLQFDIPWPASDRDTIVQVEIKRRWKPHHEVLITFRRTVDPKVAPVDGVVRVPRTIGYTRLRWLGPNRTHVIYELDSDPGGMLPHWLVRWISRSLPLKAIRGLRRQLKRRKNAYPKFLRTWDPRLSVQPDAPARFVLPGVLPANLATAAPTKAR